MTRKWALQTRYTLWRIKASIMKDLVWKLALSAVLDPTQGYKSMNNFSA